MKNIQKQIVLLLMLGVLGVSNAQDIHYSMFDMAPINLNPAQTGLFSGSVRIGGIYRSQWQGFNFAPSGNFSGYKTPAFYIDAPFAISKKDPIRHWIGAGLSFINDKVGAGNLATLAGNLSLAGHFGLGASGNTRLSVGLRGGIMQQRIDATQLRFEDGIIQGGTGNYIPTTDNTPASSSASFPDLSAGVVVSHVSSKFGMEVGFAANHVLRPKYQFLNTERRLPMGLVGSAIFNVGLSEKFFLRPQAFYQFMSKAQEINAQALFGLYLNDTKDLAVLFGPGYRVGDAVIGRLGVEYKGLKAGFAYDFNASSLSNNARAQGFEIAVSYIARITKNPVVKDILFCPRF